LRPPACTESERRRERAVPRRLVVEAEVAVELRVVAELDEAALVIEPGERLRPHRRHRPAPRVRRREQVARQRVLDVGEDQLLVLLLVVQAERGERGDLAVVAARGEERVHPLVDIGAVAPHLRQVGPRHEAALGPRVALADAVVIAVEEDAKRRIERPELRLEALEDERLEEPGDVREVPLRRARVGHRLHLAVLGRQRRSQRDARFADGRVVRSEGAGRGQAGRGQGRLHRGLLGAENRHRRGGTGRVDEIAGARANPHAASDVPHDA
jgi:hypothetical protein